MENSHPLVSQQIGREDNSHALEQYLQNKLHSFHTSLQHHLEIEIIAIINKIPIRKNFVKNLPYNPNFKNLVKEKRKAGNLAEVLFWQKVHKKKFYCIDFDRQRNIGSYIVDFYVKRLGLVVEIDAGSHIVKKDYDRQRQLYLESFGLKVFRCTDEDVQKNIVIVMTNLEQFIIKEFGVL